MRVASGAKLTSHRGEPSAAVTANARPMFESTTISGSMARGAVQKTDGAAFGVGDSVVGSNVRHAGGGAGRRAAGLVAGRSSAVSGAVDRPAATEEAGPGPPGAPLVVVVVVVGGVGAVVGAGAVVG